MMKNKTTIALIDVISRLLNPLIRRDLDAEQFGLVSITGIRVSADGSFADIDISAWQNAEDLPAEWEKHIYAWQQVLNKNLARRVVPKLRFHLSEYGDLIAQIHHEMRP